MKKTRLPGVIARDGKSAPHSGPKNTLARKMLKINKK
jgi:hypothetical protein